MNKTLIIIPTYNERDNIGVVTGKILAAYPEIDILVVDDNSPDGTGAIADSIAAAEPRVKVLHRKGKEGLGRAYVAGFKYALEHTYEFIFEMDADLSHDPKYVADFLVTAQIADLVIGSRYISGVNVINWPMARLILSYGGNIVARLVTGLTLRDCTAGYKCFRRTVLENIDLDAITSEGYSFQIEMNFKTWKMGFRIKEIPIVFVDRQKGTSKMSSKIVKETLMLLWKMRIMHLFNPIKKVV